MNAIEDYASNEVGVLLYALHQWQYLRDMGIQPLESDEMIRTGKMAAYSNILRVGTGRNVGTDEELVIQIIKLINVS